MRIARISTLVVAVSLLASTDARGQDSSHKPGAEAPDASPLEGRWTYRSLANEPDPKKSPDAVRLGDGILTVEEVTGGAFSGKLAVGELVFELKGTVTAGSVKMRATGANTAAKDFGYELDAHWARDWEDAIDPRPVLLGSIVRREAPTGGPAKPGVVASWIAVKQELRPARAPRPARAANPLGQTPEEASRRLEKLWVEFATSGRTAPERTTLVAPPLLPPEDRERALRSTAPFEEPDAIRSKEGTLLASLVVAKAHNRIGADPVFLRSYNGKLVGPTLRAHPGDTLRLTLRNDLGPEGSDDGAMNQASHGWSTTNLHTHGLHVSPNRGSDDVLLEIPGASPNNVEEYAIQLPPNHQAGTFWYHAHKHGSVAGQVSSGMSGAIVVEGGLDSLPEVVAARERILVLQQIPYSMTDARSRPLAEGVIEPELVDTIFGPTKWYPQGRFTTVNGVELPVIKARPGELERWRLIHSGVREPLNLRLETVAADAGRGPAVPLQEIAVDGIPLGKLASRDSILLDPGQRSDVLVSMPSSPGQLLLVEDKFPADRSGGPARPRYIARVVLEGPAVPTMPLPPPDALPRLRPKSLTAADVTGVQSATYGIKLTNGGVAFTIDDKPYDPTARRTLKLGGCDEWTVTVKNDVGPVGHPFHIHVNPFEVFSIVANNQEKLTEGPIWRDTLFVPAGSVVKFRTRYEDFAGEFVQHCHILDHEDQGMMQNVEIVDDRGELSLPDATGAVHDVSKLSRGPTVLFFYRGQGCPHCVEQIGAFRALTAQLKAVGATVVGIGTDTVEQLAAAKADASSLLLLADPHLRAFSRYSLVSGKEPLHAILILDGEGKEVSRRVDAEPLLDLLPVLRDLRDLVGPAVEVQVRDTPEPSGDYVTWAPAPCRVRLLKPALADVDVTLVSGEGSAPAGPPRGRVLFDRAAASGKTAVRDALALTLPRDGSWVDFVVAGKFPFASSQDKDVSIAVHRGSESGQILGEQALMVRVRKDFTKLQEDERQALLQAIHDLARRPGPTGENLYQMFVHMHDLASRGKYTHECPDQAHRSSAFIAWHRAFLLQFERELQKIDPRVTLPYWRMYKESTVFDADHFGTNTGPGGELTDEVSFSPTNPLFGWSLGYQGLDGWLGALQRRPGDTTGIEKDPLGKVVRSEEQAFAVKNGDRFLPFTAQMELNPHNWGHNWLVGWMQNCMVSPADPVFWVFHCEHDHMWARWQSMNDRYQPDGDNGASYDPVAPYELGDEIPLGHHLTDTMWPWDGTSGVQHQGDPKSNRPSPNPFPEFPPSGVTGLWPSAASKPTPSDTIDYQGLTVGRAEFGFCYDDVPFGTTKSDPLAPTLAATVRLLRESSRALAKNAVLTLRNRSASPDECVGAAQLLSSCGESGDDAAMALDEVCRDATTPPIVRASALDSLLELAPAKAVERAIEALDTAADPVVARASVGVLARAMHFGLVGEGLARKAHTSVENAAKANKAPETVTAAVRALAPMRNRVAIERLKGFLAAPSTSPLLEPELLGLLHSADPNERPVFRDRLASPATAVRVGALLGLEGDSETSARRREIARSGSEVEEMRVAALHSLMHETSDDGEPFLSIVADAALPESLRAQAAASLRVALESRAPAVERLTKIAGQLAATAISTKPDSELGRTIATVTHTIAVLKNGGQ